MAVISRTIRNRRSRRKNLQVNQPQPTNPIFITSGAAAGSVLSLMFDQAVTLHGTPGITLDNVPGATPVSAVQTGPNAVEITFSSAIDAATTLNIPFRDPAIRNTAGGYITATKVVIV